MTEALRSVVAVGGRRIDPPGAKTVQFPQSVAPRVKASIGAFLDANAAFAVVASAASGADLLALEAAAERGLRTRIVLPYDRDRFRETSVRDGGEEWVARFDRLLERADGVGDVVNVGADRADAYALAVRAIVREARKIARSAAARAIALAVWDQTFRPGTDTTRDFIDTVERSGIEVFGVPILSQ